MTTNHQSFGSKATKKLIPNYYFFETLPYQQFKKSLSNLVVIKQKEKEKKFLTFH